MMQFFRKFTTRMVLGALAIQVILTPMLFYGILFFVARGFESQFVDQARNNTYLYATLFKSALSDRNYVEQKAILDDAFLNEDLLYAEIVLLGATAVRTEPRGVSLDLEYREDFQFGEHGDQVYFISVPIGGDETGENSGQFRMGYNELPTRERIATVFRYGTFLAVGYAFLSVWMVVFFSRRLTGPVAQLRDLARNIASGGEVTDLRVDTEILEIGQLADDLDTMRQTLVNRSIAIKDRENRLYAILDNAGEGIVSIDGDGTIKSFNKAAEQIFGYPAADMIGANVSVLIPNTDQEEHSMHIGRYLETGEAKIIGKGRRVEALHRKGHIFPVHLNVTEVRHGQERTFTGLIRDLSVEEEHEKQLLQFWRVLEQVPVSIIITDTEGIIEYVNPHFSRVTGYDPKEVIGANTRLLSAGTIQPDMYRQLWTTISRGEIWRGVFQNKKKNGELFWESATICPVHDHNNRITHHIALNEDITEHREKDMMLTQAMKLEVIGRMTDGIAHDFKNLLTIMIGNLNLLNEDLAGPGNDDLLELVEDALSAAHDGSNLIEQLLLFSRREQPEPKPVEIGAFMLSLKRLLVRTIPEDIVLDLVMDDDTGAVRVDSNRLETAVLNLVINAQDAMRNGGEIVISITHLSLPDGQSTDTGEIAPGKYLSIRVTDNGIGMAPEIKKQALKPFFTTKSDSGGTGLGLSMVNDLITQSGGGVQIDSEPGEGTTVTLLLPVYEHGAAEAVKDPEVLNRLPSGTETVLLVEDREQVRRFTGRILRRLGYFLLEAEDAAEALEHLYSGVAIDLLFTDIKMPGSMDGRDLAERANREFPDLRILMTTGMKLESKDGTVLKLDFPLLRKPYSAEQLANSVRSVLETGDLANPS